LRLFVKKLRINTIKSVLNRAKMFSNLPCEMNRKIFSYYFRGISCTFCKKIFTNGYYGKDGVHVCTLCAAPIMYERGSWGFFEKCIYINNG